MPPRDLHVATSSSAFEREALFAHEWLCVGRASRIPERRATTSRATVNDEPIIVARGKDGEVRAFSAICQHRGMQVGRRRGQLQRRSRARTTMWSYDLDGRLLGAPAMERTDDFDKKDYPLPALAVELWQGFVFVNFDADAAPLAPTLGHATSRTSRNYDLERRRVPRHVHAARPAVELEGDVRELQRRLPRQPAAPHDPGLLPERAGGVPGRVGRRLERHLPHQRLHPHRRRLQRHHQGAHAGLPEADRGGALALDVRADAADAVLRHRARSGVLLHRAPEDGRHDRRRDRLPVPPARARAPDVRPPASR